MRDLGLVLLLTMVASFGSGAAAQQTNPQPTSPTQAPVPGAPAPARPVTPPRDPRLPADVKKGTAILRGYVVAADTGNPVRRAMVRVNSSTGGGNNVTSTDGEGRWEVKDLPAGAYIISVSKPGYVSTSYGQRSPMQGGRPLDVLDGQLVEKIGFSLARGGVITGRLTDDFGDPIAGVQVNALREQFAGGSRRLFPVGNATTDDLGAFRLYGLAPGEYYVSGVMRQMSMMMPGQSSSDIEGFATTYYPGTTSPAQGQRVTVRATQEVQNVSFALSATRLTTISGRVVSSTNEPVAQANVRVTPADRNDFMATMNFNMAMTRGDGDFQLSGMTPGNYVLVVSPRNSADPASEFAQHRVTVGNDSIENVLIVTSRGAVMLGAITTDEGTPLPVRPTQVNVFARPADFGVPAFGPSMAPKVNDDWTFEVSGLDDRRIVGAAVMESPDWTMKAVYHNGIDVTDTGIDFVPGQTVQGVEIVFSRKRTELSGLVSGAGGKPDLDATVIAFAQDSRRLTPGNRYLRTGRPNQDGRYTIRGLPPEDYFVAVVRELEPGRTSDPEFLETLRDSAVRITLTEGETKTQDVKAPPRR